MTQLPALAIALPLLVACLLLGLGRWLPRTVVDMVSIAVCVALLGVLTPLAVSTMDGRVVDWVGGFPFEVATPEQIFDFYRQRGFSLERLLTCGGTLGCNQFVFRRTGSAAPRV